MLLVLSLVADLIGWVVSVTCNVGDCNGCSFGDEGDSYGSRECGGDYGYGCSDGCFW